MNHNLYIENIAKTNKPPKSKTMKITFNESEKSLKAKVKGLIMFSMCTPHYNIAQDKYHNIQS